jgi:4-diphosphocytidyl-2-C-methyl-D-erythritol kinase
MLTLKAPAKINWFLKVVRRRDDGFHEIQSVVQKVSLYDLITFSLSDRLVLTTDSDIPTEDNLVYKAANLLKNRYKVNDGASIDLKKSIPLGAGLGGGSSDAATALMGLNRLWSLGLTLYELSEIAQELGSDVPFFLHSSVSYIYGRGEKVIPGTAEVPVYLLLVKPGFDVSTAWAYNNISELTKEAVKEDNIRYFLRKIGKAEISDIAGGIFNDLEPVTVSRYPVIAEIKERLLTQGAAVSLMSGSGSAVFGVFESETMAAEASGAFKGFWTAVVQTITD